MPTYEYCCSSCGHLFEEHQSITADPIRECPQCGGEVRRMISGGSGFILKGKSHSHECAGNPCRPEGDCGTRCGGDGCCGGSMCGGNF